MFNQQPQQNNSRLAELANAPQQPMMLAANGAPRFQPQQEQGLTSAAMDANQYRKAYNDYVLSTMESGENPLQFEEFVRTIQGQ